MSLQDQFNERDLSENNSPKEEGRSVSEQYFAIGTEPRFKLLLRSGAAYSVQYATISLISLWEDRSGLSILAPDLHIAVRGRNLIDLLGYFNNEEILYLKESASGTDVGQKGVFISSIQLEGEALEQYTQFK